jgi:hypothetical protein
LQNGIDGNFAWRAKLVLQRAHGIVIGMRQGDIEGKPPSSVVVVVQSNQDICPSAGYSRIDGLADPSFEFSQITRQVDCDFALFPIYGAKLHAQLGPFAIGFAAAISSHTSHRRPVCL